MTDREANKATNGGLISAQKTGPSSLIYAFEPLDSLFLNKNPLKLDICR